MSGSQEERERIFVFSHIKPLSTGDAVTSVHLEALTGRVQFILESPAIFIGRFCCIGKTQKIDSVEFQKVGCHCLSVQSTGNTDIQVSATDQFFGNNVDRRTAHITDTSGIKCLINANRLNNIRTEEVERDILIFRIFRRNRKSVKGSRVIAVAQSTDKDILDSILFRNPRHFGYSALRIGNTFAGKLLDADSLHGNDCFLLFEQQHILILAILLCYHHYIREFMCIRLQFQIQNHQFPVLHTNFAAYFRLVSYIFYFNIIHTFQHTGTVQLKITVHIGHSSGRSSHQSYRCSNQRFFGELVFHRTFNLDIGSQCRKNTQQTKKGCNRKSKKK